MQLPGILTYVTVETKNFSDLIICNNSTSSSNDMWFNKLNIIYEETSKESF